MKKKDKVKSGKCKSIPQIFYFSIYIVISLLCIQPIHADSLLSTLDQEIESQIKKREVKGVVRDQNGEAIIGATIVEKGNMANGTITDIEGYFQFQVSENSVLVVSYVGYQDKEVQFIGERLLEIVLDEDNQLLDEVVVVGYGTVRKKDLTGAVGTVSGDIIAQRKTMSLGTALQGSIPGLMVTRSTGLGGGSADVKIRGITTIGDSSPLIIVDGAPVDNMDVVNPNDIENVSVLKDAASASIYGSRAASGVILITTKRAQEEQFSFKYSTEMGYEKMITRPRYVGAVRFMELENEMRWNDAGGDNHYLAYSKDLIDNYMTLNNEDPDSYPNTDWWDLVVLDKAPRQSHYLDVAGGSKKIRSKATFGYDNVDGLYANRNNERYTFRVNNDMDITKFLSSSFDVSFRRATTLSPLYDPFTSSGNINGVAPIYPGLWQDGRYAGIAGSVNMHAQIKDGGAVEHQNNQLSGKMSVSFKPVDGLSLTGLFSPNFTFYKGKSFTKKLGFYDAKDPSLFVTYYSGNEETKLQESRNDSYNYTIQFIGNYEKSINNEHSFNIMAGYEGFKSFNEVLSAGRGHFELSSFPYLNLGSLEYRTNGGSASEYAYQSYFARLMYNYKNKYLFQTNIRRDASSRFHKDHRWGTFPSLSVGWVISEENFYEAGSWLPFLKMRLSWGNLGNERIGNYPYQSAIRYTNILFYDGDKVISSQGATQSNFAIKDITWEKTESWDIGLDAYFLDNRLRFSGDYYRKETKEMLLALEIPDYVGYDNPDNNTGKMHTTGFEVEVGWNDKIGDWNYGASFNISDFKSKMGNLGGTEFLGSQVKKEGSEFNEWYGYLSSGLYQTQEDVDNSPKLNNNVKVGDVKYLDVSGPDGVPDGRISPEYDRVLLGGSLPRFMYGGNLFVNYKRIDLSVAFQGVGKQNSLLSTDMIQPFINNRGNVPQIIDNKFWSAHNADEENMNAKYPRLSYTNSANNYAMSDYWLFNGRYLRIKNITLGYILPETWIKVAGIKELRLYVSVNDLHAISNYPKGWDPEQKGFSYPMTSSYLLGASVKF